MVKLIISDLDGTLLDENKNLPKDFDEMYVALEKKGILFVPASGRQCDNLKKVFNKYKNNMAFIGENGAFTSLPNGKDIALTIPTDITNDILQTIKDNPKIEVVIGGVKGAYTINSSESFISHAKQYYSNLKTLDDITSINDEIIKFAIYNETDMENSCYPIFKKYEDCVQLVFGAKGWLDITAQGVNKGAAIKRLQKELNIKNTETVCFGDYLNDLSMFDKDVCYYSYAMENAHPELKKIAKAIAPANTNSGVTKIIRNLISQTNS